MSTKRPWCQSEGAQIPQVRLTSCRCVKVNLPLHNSTFYQFRASSGQIIALPVPGLDQPKRSTADGRILHTPSTAWICPSFNQRNGHTGFRRRSMLIATMFLYCPLNLLHVETTTLGQCRNILVDLSRCRNGQFIFGQRVGPYTAT